MAAHQKHRPAAADRHDTNGKTSVAVRVTKDPSKVRAGRRPTTVYVGAQHAREWITPEMVRRLLEHVLDDYGTDAGDHGTGRQRTSCGSSRSPTPTATTSRSPPGNRLWRKNLRDNDGDGQITGATAST